MGIICGLYVPGKEINTLEGKMKISSTKISLQIQKKIACI